MKKQELTNLRNMMILEKNRRERLNLLYQKADVIEFLKLSGMEEEVLDSNDEIGILLDILENFQVTKTNKIYVCTSENYRVCNSYNQEYSCYEKKVDIHSNGGEYRKYKDIEDQKVLIGYLKKDEVENGILCRDFEEENIVLNPYGTYKDMNGYQEVRQDFFYEAIKKGQPKAKEYVLKKYKRL